MAVLLANAASRERRRSPNPSAKATSSNTFSLQGGMGKQSEALPAVGLPVCWAPSKSLLSLFLILSQGMWESRESDDYKTQNNSNSHNCVLFFKGNGMFRSLENLYIETLFPNGVVLRGEVLREVLG